MSCFDIASLAVQALIAIGTIGTFVFSLIQIRDSRKQFDAVRKEQAELQRKSHASRIAAWFERNEKVEEDANKAANGKFLLWTIRISNGNKTPIYDVVVTVVGQHGAGPRNRGEENDGDCPYRALFHEVPPGEWTSIIQTSGGGMHVVTTLEISFTDPMGNHWIRRGNGILEQIDSDPLRYYKIVMPCSWARLLRSTQS